MVPEAGAARGIALMRRRATYDPFKVIGELIESRAAKWDMAKRPVRGKEYIYEIQDRNFHNYNKWEFVVRAPYKNSRDKNIQVQPLEVPRRPIWAGIDYRVITFIPTTIGNHLDKYYCKIFFSDVSGNRTKQGTRRGDRKYFPDWLQINYFKSRMRLKKTVAKTQGYDHMAQVMIVNPHDHMRMIRIFFANKVWILSDGYHI
jgi:hypothetical protein